MWLHKFIPQPCFDNAGAGRGGGPSGGGIKTGGVDRRESEPGGIGLSNNVGRADMGSRSDRGGGGGSTVTRTTLPPPAPTVPKTLSVRPGIAPPSVLAARPAMDFQKGITGYGFPSLDQLAANITGQSLASIQGNTAPAPSISRASPPTRSPIGYSGAARQVGARAAAQSQANSEAVHDAVRGGLSRGSDGPSFSGGPQGNLSGAIDRVKEDRNLSALSPDVDATQAMRNQMQSFNRSFNNDVAAGLLSNRPNETIVSKPSNQSTMAKTSQAPIGLINSMKALDPDVNPTMAMQNTLQGFINNYNRGIPTPTPSPSPASGYGNLYAGLSNENINQDPLFESNAGKIAAYGPALIARDYAKIGRNVPSGLPQVNAQSRAVQNAIKSLDLSKPSYAGFSRPEVGVPIGSPIPGVDEVQGPGLNYNLYGPTEAYPNLSDQPGAYSNENDVTGYTDATDITQDVMSGNFSDAVSKTIDKFGVGTAMQIAGLLSGMGGNRPDKTQDRERGIGMGEQSGVRDAVIGLLTGGGGGNSGGGGTDTGTDTTPPPTQGPWTPPGLLSRPYSNPFAYRNPWLNV